MKKVFVTLVFLSFLSLFLFFTQDIYAQGGQIWQTIVGTPDEEESSGGNGGSGGSGGSGGGSGENLPPGVFKPPFSCNIRYGGATYSGPRHVWEIDFNRSDCREDEGDPVYSSAPGTVRYVDRADYGLVVISHNGGYATGYGHMRNIQVRPTQKVSLHQKIGEISDVSLDNIRPHLHYYHQKNNNNIRVEFDGKPHPASLPGNRDLPYSCPFTGFVSCRVLY